MLWSAGLAVAGVTITWQLAEAPEPDSTQVVALKASLATDELSVIMPLGVTGLPFRSSSVTVTATADAWFTTTAQGFKETVVDVCRVWTTCETPAEMLGLKLLSPEYFAVSVSVPAACGVIAQLPVPELSELIVHDSPAPSYTVTEPVGVPEPGAFTVTDTVTVTA